jgi:hypothetical protein
MRMRVQVFDVIETLLDLLRVGHRVLRQPRRFISIARQTGRKVARIASGCEHVK